jgi:hypothetical protein
LLFSFGLTYRNYAVVFSIKGLWIKRHVRSRDSGTKNAIWVKYPLSLFHNNYRHYRCTILLRIKGEIHSAWEKVLLKMIDESQIQT